MLPMCSNSPRQKPSTSVPGPIAVKGPPRLRLSPRRCPRRQPAVPRLGAARRRSLRPALETPREPFGQPGGADFLRGQIVIVGHTEKSESRPLELPQCVARLVAAVAWLAGRADDREPLAVGSRRDGGC